jgi:putative two-component system response regulator
MREKTMAEKKPTILIVEDEPINVKLLIEALGEEYTFRVAPDGVAALASVKKNLPDLILLDIVMPDMDGFAVCRRLKYDPALRDISVIFLTALSGDLNEAQGLELGVVDYITKPFNPAIVKARVRNHLELKFYRDLLEDIVRKRTADLEQTQEATIAGMALLAEYRDPETGGHIQRTKHYVRTLAEAMSARYPDTLTPEYIDLLYRSAPLHDIGKVAVNDSILLKPGELTSEEFSEMKRHTLVGSEVIRRAEMLLGEKSFLSVAREIAEFHHERWDGSGYPHGLKGEEIPLNAQLMAIADIYDALTSRRVYKPPYHHKKAFDIIINGDDRIRPEIFSPAIVDGFRAVHLEWMRISSDFLD